MNLKKVKQSLYNNLHLKLGIENLRIMGFSIFKII